jgi:hypothetical protein
MTKTTDAPKSKPVRPRLRPLSHAELGCVAGGDVYMQFPRSSNTDRLDGGGSTR